MFKPEIEGKDCPQPKELEFNNIKNVIYVTSQRQTSKKPEFIVTLENDTNDTYARIWQVNRKSPFQKNELTLEGQDSIKSIEIRSRKKNKDSYYIISLTKDSKVAI